VPIHEYRCQDCGAEFEKLVNAGSVVTCPACTGSHLMRRLSLFGMRAGATAGVPAPAASKAASMQMIASA